jgi:hypothetical protein
MCFLMLWCVQVQQSARFCLFDHCMLQNMGLSTPIYGHIYGGIFDIVRHSIYSACAPYTAPSVYEHTVVFPKVGQLEERDAGKHGLIPRQIGQCDA